MHANWQARFFVNLAGSVEVAGLQRHFAILANRVISIVSHLLMKSKNPETQILGKKLMAITYVNRKGQTFYLHQGVTRKGNPKYSFSQKREGELVDSIPKGFEIYEHPNARVFLRRIRPKLITDEEVEIVCQGMDKYCEVKYYQIDVKKNIIGVFLVDQDVEILSESYTSSPSMKSMTPQEVANEIGSYSPWLNFVLIDNRRRLFVTERHRFFGSDEWMEIGEPAKLVVLVKKYVKHLGQGSYFLL